MNFWVQAVKKEYGPHPPTRVVALLDEMRTELRRNKGYGFLNVVVRLEKMISLDVAERKRKVDMDRWWALTLAEEERKLRDLHKRAMAELLRRHEKLRADQDLRIWMQSVAR